MVQFDSVQWLGAILIFQVNFVWSQYFRCSFRFSKNRAYTITWVNKYYKLWGPLDARMRHMSVLTFIGGFIEEKLMVTSTDWPTDRVKIGKSAQRNSEGAQGAPSGVKGTLKGRTDRGIGYSSKVDEKYDLDPFPFINFIHHTCVKKFYFQSLLTRVSSITLLIIRSVIKSWSSPIGRQPFCIINISNAGWHASEGVVTRKAGLGKFSPWPARSIMQVGE